MWLMNNDFVFLHNRGYSKKFHKPWQGPFKVVEVLGTTVYRIAECANPRRQKVVHFNRLKPAPAEAESQPPPEVIQWSCTPRLPTDPAGALPNAGDYNEDIQPPIVPIEPEDRQPEPEDRQPVIELVPDVPAESEGLPYAMLIQLKFLRPYKMKISLVEKAV